MGFWKNIGNFFKKTFTPKKWERQQREPLWKKEARDWEQEKREHAERKSIFEVKTEKSKAIKKATARLSKAEAKRRSYQEAVRKAKKELNNAKKQEKKEKESARTPISADPFDHLGQTEPLTGAPEPITPEPEPIPEPTPEPTPEPPPSTPEPGTGDGEGDSGPDMPDLWYRGINTMLVVWDKEPEDLVKKDGTVYGFWVQGLDFMGNWHSYVFSLNDKIYEN